MKTTLFTSYNFAYYAVYNKHPPGINRQLTEPPLLQLDRHYKELIYVDSVIKDEWIESLLTINKDFDLLSISPGYNRYYVMHIIFAVRNTEQSKVEQFILNLMKPNTYKIYINCSYLMINETDAYVCIATQNWYRLNVNENNKWLIWWNYISDVINSAII